jgi:hypothetical protein
VLGGRDHRHGFAGPQTIGQVPRNVSDERVLLGFGVELDDVVG